MVAVESETRNALVMDTEENDLETELLVRQVFAYFGRAMYAANCVEQALIIALMEADLMSRTVSQAQKIGDIPNRQTWESMFDEFMEKHDGLMFGDLISRFRSVVKPDSKLLGLLDQCRDKRNHLAHAFFRENAVAFAHNAGCVEMISELDDIHDLFICTENLVVAAVSHVLPRLGIDPGKHHAEAAKIAEDLLNEARERAAQHGETE